MKALKYWGLNGGPNRTRTCDHYLVEVVLYQLSYKTIIINARSKL